MCGVNRHELNARQVHGRQPRLGLDADGKHLHLSRLKFDLADGLCSKLEPPAGVLCLCLKLLAGEKVLYFWRLRYNIQRVC